MRPRLATATGALLFAIAIPGAPADESYSVTPGRLGWPTELMLDDSQRRRPVDAPPELNALRQLAPNSPGSTTGADNMRMAALREVALTLGVQAGVRWRYQIINTLMLTNQQTLDKAVDFRPLLLHGGRVAPAVITRSEGGYRITSDTEASQTMATYYIERDARLISRPPDWRDYLLRDYPMFRRHDDVMLPKDAAERKAWSSTVEKGFWQGVAQADTLFDANLGQLRKDYLGMAHFKLLALQGMVKVPMLADSNLGVVVDGRMLSVGERVFRITEPTDFRPVRNWQPVIKHVPAAPALVSPQQKDAK